ncbi:MAG: hypothetical protein IJG49_08850 [Erysipelotrichaceae bacterium]|nr:hypothetical protein [Erysipelotrichaceae bacterium]
MALTSLLLSILSIVILFLLAGAYGLGIFVSFGLSVLSLIFGIIGLKSKKSSATAGIVFSVLTIIADVFLYIIAFTHILLP